MLRKSLPVFSTIAKSNIDSVNGVIKNIVIINSGADKVGDNIDSTFLKQVYEHGNSQSQGVKCRFGHPNLCSDALGDYVGRYKNFQVTETSVLADLHLDSVARNSPKGNLHDYVLEFAQKNDDMFGNSIVFRADEPEVVVIKSDDGTEETKEFIRLKSLVASDLVDSPAATNSLFKSDDDFAARATEFLDDNDELFERMMANPKVTTDFLTKYFHYKSRKSNSTLIMDTTKSDTLLSEIKKGISDLKEKFFPKQKGTLQVTTADGTVLNVDDSDDSGTPAVGDNVVIDGNANPDGTYVMPDGSSIMVAEGKISEITAVKVDDQPPATPDTPAPAKSDAEILELKAENEKLTAELKEKSDALEALNQKVEETQKAFTDFKNTITSKYKPEETETRFRKTETGDGEKSLKEKMDERREEIRTKKEESKKPKLQTV